MKKEPKYECKQGCVYYDRQNKNCRYPDNECALNDLPFYEKENVPQKESRRIPMRNAAAKE